MSVHYIDPIGTLPVDNQSVLIMIDTYTHVEFLTLYDLTDGTARRALL
jgi:hypothetical protein